MQNWTPGIAATNSEQGWLNCKLSRFYRFQGHTLATSGAQSCKRCHKPASRDLCIKRVESRLSVLAAPDKATNGADGKPAACLSCRRNRLRAGGSGIFGPARSPSGSENLGRHRRQARAGERRRGSMLATIRLPVAGCRQFRHCRGMPASSREL